MGKFNIGDLVSPNMDYGDTVEGDVFRNEVYEIVGKCEPPLGYCYKLRNCSLEFHPENLRKAGVINNKLNRKLYPNWKEYKAYLVSPKTASKLSEESNEL